MLVVCVVVSRAGFWFGEVHRGNSVGLPSLLASTQSLAAILREDEQV